MAKLTKTNILALEPNDNTYQVKIWLSTNCILDAVMQLDIQMSPSAYHIALRHGCYWFEGVPDDITTEGNIAAGDYYMELFTV
jgi:hypothetical protein